jgi:predicted RNase H-like HicB family nuclease
MPFTAVFLEVPEGYHAFVEELPGTDVFAESLSAARTELAAQVARVVATQRELAESLVQTSGLPYRRETLTVDLAVEPACV